MSMHLLFGVGGFSACQYLYQIAYKKIILLLIASWHFILAVMTENYLPLLKISVFLIFIYFKSIPSNVMWYKALYYINNTNDIDRISKSA